MEIITYAAVRDNKISGIFRNLHMYTKDDGIASFDEDSTELLVTEDFEQVIDQLIVDLENLQKGEEAWEWFNVDDEFTLQELLLAKNEMVEMRNKGFKSITVYTY